MLLEYLDSKIFIPIYYEFFCVTLNNDNIVHIVFIQNGINYIIIFRQYKLSYTPSLQNEIKFVTTQDI